MAAPGGNPKAVVPDGNPETVELVFCKTCGLRRIREVVKDLRRLFREKILKPNTCGICRRDLDWFEAQKPKTGSHPTPHVLNKNIIVVTPKETPWKHIVSVAKPSPDVTTPGPPVAISDPPVSVATLVSSPEKISSPAVAIPGPPAVASPVQNTGESESSEPLKVKKELQSDEQMEDNDGSNLELSDTNTDETEMEPANRNISFKFPKMMKRGLDAPAVCGNNSYSQIKDKRSEIPGNHANSYYINTLLPRNHFNNSKDLNEDIDNEVRELIQMEEDPEAVASLNVDESEEEDEINLFDRIQSADPGLVMFLTISETSKRPYKCSICKETFHLLATFATHVSKHTGKAPLSKPYWCPKCRKNFTGKEFNRHRLSHAKRLRVHKCLYAKCKYTFKNKLVLKTHLEVHRGLRRYLCKTCGSGFWTKNDLDTHMKIHSNDKSLFCKYCNKCFKTEISLRTHELHSHENKDKYECDLCFAYTCSSLSRLKEHKQTHVEKSDLECEKCGQVFNCKTKFNRHVKLDSCDDSGGDDDINEFTEGVDERLVALMDLPIRRKDKPFKCKFCVLMEFKSAKALLEHIKEKHEEEECPVINAYRCSGCAMSFRHKQSFMSHKTSKHSDARPYTCEYESCDKTFKTKSGLRRHNRWHEGFRPKPSVRQFVCSICGVKMASKTNLIEHEQCVHFDNKPFKCQECGTRHRTECKLKLHIDKVHRNVKRWVCKVCDKRFKTGPELKTHSYLHTGEKPFECEFCDFKSTRQGSLKLHRRQHTGEKPYKCSKCSKQFIQRPSLTLHMKNHHGIYKVPPINSQRLYNQKTPSSSGAKMTA